MPAHRPRAAGPPRRVPRATGWQAQGRDIDPDAVAAARFNVPGAQMELGDPRAIAAEDTSVRAVVSNLPFGQQFDVDGEMTRRLADVLAELERVAAPGARIVLLAPQVPEPRSRQGCP